MNAPKEMKVIFIGDAEAGKTFLISSFIFGYPVIPKKPILFGTYSRHIAYNNNTYKLRICDTYGSPEFMRLQEMSYLDADVMVLCIDGTDIASLKNAERYAIQSKKARVPIVLCITKVDRGVKLSDSQLISFKNKYRLNSVVKVSVYDKKSVEYAFEKMVDTSINDKFIESSYCGKIFSCC